MRSPKKESKVFCGKLGRAVGLCGAMRFHPVSENSSVRSGFQVFVEGGGKLESHTISGLRKQGRFFVIEFAQIKSRKEAQALCGCNVSAMASDLPQLEKDEYYCYEVEGLSVVTVDGEKIGIVSGVISTGANDVYEVDSEIYKEVLIPAIKDVVVNIDMDSRVMTIDPLKGMLEKKT